MRNNDVKKLLKYVEDSLAQLKKDYEQSLEDKDISDDLIIQVKNIMENLRSALDYMACDVYETVIVPSQKVNKKIYFPYGKDKQTFDSMIKKNLPSLEIISRKIYLLIESMQPHACDDRWLYDFCKIQNDNKHDFLSPQTKTVHKTYSIGLAGKPPFLSAPADGIKASPGVITICGIPISFDGETGIPHKTPGLEVEVVTWVGFVFQGTTIDVYPFLKKVFDQIDKLSRDIYASIDKSS